MGKVIGIINQKGGVGKTTTAVNLASCLALSGHKTLLIDSDSQGNTTTGLGFEKEKLQNTLYEVLINGEEPSSAVVKTKIKKLHLLPAKTSLAGAEIELVGMTDREYIMKKAVSSIRDNYEYIIIDCPPSLGLMTLNSLVASDSILVPIQAEFYALEGVVQLMKTIKSVQKKMNPSIYLEGVLLTMFDGRTNLSLQVAEEVKKYFGEKVFRTMIPRSVKISESPSFGEPVVTYDPKSKGAEAYNKLCREVVRRA